MTEEVKNTIRNTFQTKKRWHKVKVAEELITQLQLSLSVEEVICIGITPTPEEVRAFVKKHKLCCDVCKTDEFIVGEPVGLDEEGFYNRIEYYCANPNTGSTVFSKCWNHVFSYGKNGVFKSINKVVCTE